MSGAATSRLAFVTRVRDILDDAVIEYAFLHNLDVPDQSDSDVDIVVNPESLGVLDTAIRAGKLGRLVQRIDYDIPWCRYYILETCEAERRFRQLDVGCDPLGIGRYGEALRRAFAGRERIDGWPVLGADAEVVYLAAKRARKGIRGSDDVAQLLSTYTTAPGAEDALIDAFGEAGTRLAHALAREEPLDSPLRAVSATILRGRRTPSRMAQRGWFEANRAARRFLRPTGLAIVLVGPDGVGKSTLADGLESASYGLFRRVSRLHLTPSMLPPPARLLGRAGGDQTEPHARAPSGWVGSLARVGYLATDTLLGWWPRVFMPRIRSNLVVLERGWHDLQVDPRRYRLGAGSRTVRVIGWLLPRADFTLVLGGPSTEIHVRKPELGVEEIERQQAAWLELASHKPMRFITVQASTPDEALESAVKVIANKLATRAGALDAFETAITCLGSPRVGGEEFAVLSARGRPRWIMPRRRGAPGPLAASLYRPASARHSAGAAILEARSRLGVPLGPSLTLDPSLGLGPQIARLLDLDKINLAALLPTDPARTQRTVLAVLHRGRPVAIAKVAERDSSELARELRALTALETCQTCVLEPPRLLGSLTWRGRDVAVIEALGLDGRTNRPLDSTEEDALVELASLRERLAPALEGHGAVPVHGDFCGWNTSVHGGRLQIWDWEWTHLGEPLEDWFHWQTQQLVHFRRGTPIDLVGEALNPSPRLRALCARLDTESDTAPTALAASLRQGLARLEGSTGSGVELRRQALALLKDRTR